MIRHVVLFRWKPEATQEQRTRAAAEVAKLPSIVPTVLGFASGSDIGVNQGNFEFSVTADFEDENGYLAYRDHPGHRQVVADYIAPILAERAAIQFQFA
jgi:hypothetical protein